MIRALIFFLFTTFYSDIPEGNLNTLSLASPFSQRYCYCGKGAQVIAFQSQDGHYVLKLFRAKHKKSFRFRKPLRWFKKETPISRQKWKEKFEDTKRRYLMAFEHLQEESGLIFLHFEKTKDPLFVTIDGRKMDLASYPFILQKKATLAPCYLKANPEKKEEIIQQLRTFFKTRLDKGFSDPRQALSINYGFIDNRPIQIDVGKIEPFEGDKKEELRRIYSHIDEWILTQSL